MFTGLSKSRRHGSVEACLACAGRAGSAHEKSTAGATRHTQGMPLREFLNRRNVPKIPRRGIQSSIK